MSSLLLEFCFLQSYQHDKFNYLITETNRKLLQLRNIGSCFHVFVFIYRKIKEGSITLISFTFGNTSCLLPLFHNESSFKPFHIKLSWICMKINTLMKQVLTEAKEISEGNGLLRLLTWEE